MMEMFWNYIVVWLDNILNILKVNEYILIWKISMLYELYHNFKEKHNLINKAKKLKDNNLSLF